MENGISKLGVQLSGEMHAKHAGDSGLNPQHGKNKDISLEEASQLASNVSRVTMKVDFMCHLDWAMA